MAAFISVWPIAALNSSELRSWNGGGCSASAAAAAASSRRSAGLRRSLGLMSARASSRAADRKPLAGDRAVAGATVGKLLAPGLYRRRRSLPRRQGCRRRCDSLAFCQHAPLRRHQAQDAVDHRIRHAQLVADQLTGCCVVSAGQIMADTISRSQSSMTGPASLCMQDYSAGAPVDTKRLCGLFFIRDVAPLDKDIACASGA